MDRPEQLADLQVELAGIFFALDAAKDYLVAGGAALLASDLIARPTEDLDSSLRHPRPRSPSKLAQLSGKRLVMVPPTDPRKMVFRGKSVASRGNAKGR